jgi:putative acyl-CoA dehydrogenase
MCLDVLRAFSKSARTADVVLAELELVRGRNQYYDRAFGALAHRLKGGMFEESEARLVVQELVLTLEAALLLGSSREEVAQAFCQQRLSGGPGSGAVFGNARAPSGAHAILEGAWSEGAHASAD